jgi:8-oxo-dGTP diphosphatase
MRIKNNRFIIVILYKFKDSFTKTKEVRFVDTTAREIYGDRVRSRVCGLCMEGDTILLVNHAGLYGHDFWAPPGGGIQFGQPASLNLLREFKEETGLDVQVGEFLFACEFIHQPLHAIELFFKVTVTGGKLIRGVDPEMGKEKQVIHSVKYMTWREVDSLPPGHLHGAFGQAHPKEKIVDLRGYLRI